MKKNFYWKTEKMGNSFYIRNYEKLRKMRNYYTILAGEYYHNLLALENRRTLKNYVLL